MKVLSIKEPFATLIKEKQKIIETRSWKTNYRGEFYIHASKAKINNKDSRTKELLNLIPNISMNYGNIICKCILKDCIYMDENFLEEIKKNHKEYICGHYEIGRYAWVLEVIEVLETPLPAKGKLGIWNYEINKKTLQK